MKEKQQKGMRQRAIEQFADVTTAFVAETFDLIDFPRSKSATRIKSAATNNRTNDSTEQRFQDDGY
jgi:hypothetical protein